MFNSARSARQAGSRSVPSRRRRARHGTRALSVRRRHPAQREGARAARDASRGVLDRRRVAFADRTGRLAVAMPLPLPDPPLADDAVRLRPWGANDVDALVDAWADEEIQRWTRVPQQRGARRRAAVDRGRGTAPGPRAVARSRDLSGGRQERDRARRGRHGAAGRWTVAGRARLVGRCAPPPQHVATRAVGLFADVVARGTRVHRPVRRGRPREPGIRVGRGSRTTSACASSSGAAPATNCVRSGPYRMPPCHAETEWQGTATALCYPASLTVKRVL